MIIRTALISDIKSILQLGTSFKEFSVSDTILFYEETELSDFINDSNWVIGVAIRQDELIGFISIHRMSSHWAMLDNFYVVPKNRGTGLAKLMYNWLIEQVKPWGISYISCLVDLEDEITTKLLTHKSWKPRKRYQWLDLEI